MNKTHQTQEFLLEHDGIGSVLGMLGCQCQDTISSPPSTIVKDPVLSQLLFRSQLWLGNSICLRVAKKEKNKTPTPLPIPAYILPFMGRGVGPSLSPP